MGINRSNYLWQKTPIQIDDISIIDGDVIEVVIQETGKTARIRRDLADFFPGIVYVPLWLAERLKGNKIDDW